MSEREKTKIRRVWQRDRRGGRTNRPVKKKTVGGHRAGYGTHYSRPPGTAPAGPPGTRVPAPPAPRSASTTGNDAQKRRRVGESTQARQVGCVTWQRLLAASRYFSEREPL